MRIPSGGSAGSFLPRGSSFRPAFLPLLCLLALPVTVSGPLEAQRGGVSLDAGISHALPPSGSEAEPATHLLAALRLDRIDGAGSALRAELAGGKSFEPEAGDWGTASVDGELWTSVGRGIRLGAGARGEGMRVGAPHPYRAFTAELRPGVWVRLGEADLLLRGEGGAGRAVAEISEVGGLSGTVPGPPDPPVHRDSTIESDLWYVGGGPELRVRLGEIRAGVEAGVFETPRGDYRQGALSLVGGGGRTGWHAILSAWGTPNGARIAGELAISVPLGGGWGAHAGGGRSEPGRLLGTRSGTRGGAVVSRRLIEFGSASPAPLYSVLREEGGARVRFRLSHPDAERVVVMGGFSGWTPVDMQREGDVWTATIPVEPGVYHFGFRVDGEWFVPDTASGRVRDEWGRTNATLVVPADG